ncbi:type II secretion system F family protein [Candidatus Gracilibacteria bacterium]|nr:type II secretion system F family protein [Candidatus Gracilibacteria bacterium]
MSSYTPGSDQNVQGQNTGGILGTINEYLLSIQTVKTKDKVIFYRLLSTMTNAGMTLLKGIEVLHKQEKNEVLKKILADIHVNLKEGKSFCECLEPWSNSFSEAERGVIRSGETTGRLNEVLLDLADQIEKLDSISGKIKSAMIYPACIVLVVCGVVAVMMIKVVPNLLEIFDDKSALPPSTQVLIQLSNLFTQYWFLGIILAILAYIGVTLWRKTPDGHYLYDSFVLKIPVFGGINRKLILSKFSRVLAGLLASGVSFVEALKITSEAVGNEVYKQRILLMSEDVKQGIKIFESLDGDPLFPEMMVQMIQVGEQTAKLDQTVVKVADFYDEEIDNTVLVLNKLLEPFIIVFLAVVVGFIAIAIMQPIMGLADTISQG